VQEALERIYHQHRQGLYTLALSVTGHCQQAEDAVHDAFERLCRSENKPRGNLTSYVYAAVRNAAVDQIRRRKTTTRSTVSIFDDTAVARERPDADLALQERDAAIRRAVDDLPEPQRAAVVMKIYGGLTFAQIAEAMDEPLSTVASRYQRALENLKPHVELLV